MDTNTGLYNNALPFELGVFEIQDNADSQPGDAEVIYHLSALVIGNVVNDLGVHHNGGMGDEVWNKLAHFDLLVEDIELSLLIEGDATQLELHDQRVFVNFFVQAVPDAVEHLQRAPDQLINFVLEDELGVFST